jgi:hypothetical protein
MVPIEHDSEALPHKRAISENSEKNKNCFLISYSLQCVDLTYYPMFQTWPVKAVQGGAVHQQKAEFKWVWAREVFNFRCHNFLLIGTFFRQTDGQRDRQTDRQAERQTDIPPHFSILTQPLLDCRIVIESRFRGALRWPEACTG